jgi:NADH:ubiquinone oxidoreductase subunit F (NADH-binding)
MQLLKAPKGWPSILLARARTYDPDSAGAGLAAAEAGGAWTAWRRAVTGLSPESVIRAVSESGLRGRGGAGFPTGQKWLACRSAESSVRYAVANGFEADPGAQADRTLMESDPHAVLEGLALAAFAIDATRAWLAVNAGYVTAIRRLRAALEAAETGGYLGGNVLGTGRELWIEVREVSGSFAVGEETTLLRAIENKRAQPDQRPPWPAERGLWDKPTLVNNVETLAAVPWIVNNGAAAWRAIGDREDPGTTLVQLSGAVAKPGIAEVPTGTPLRTLLETVAGGMSAGPLKAIHVGGPSGGFLPPAALDTPLSHAALAEAGAIMGSGTILAVDGTSCIVDLATLLTRFVSDEACGKTIPCRIGTRRLAELGDGFCTGRCRPSDPDLLRSLASDVRDAALCGLEATAINPLLSGMRYFSEEFEDHVLRSSCPAGVCHPIRVAAAAAT